MKRKLAKTAKPTDEILCDMRPWFTIGTAVSVAERTTAQANWDRAILAASEFVRRKMDYDESIALDMHQLLSTKLTTGR